MLTVHPDEGVEGIHDAIDSYDDEYHDKIRLVAGTYEKLSGEGGLGIDKDGVVVEGTTGTVIKIPDGATEVAQCVTIAADNVTVRGITADGNRPNLNLDDDATTARADGICIYGENCLVERFVSKRAVGHGIGISGEDGDPGVNVSGIEFGHRRNSKFRDGVAMDSGHPDDSRAVVDIYDTSLRDVRRVSVENIISIRGEHSGSALTFHGAHDSLAKNMYLTYDPEYQSGGAHTEHSGNSNIKYENVHIDGDGGFTFYGEDTVAERISVGGSSSRAIESRQGLTVRDSSFEDEIRIRDNGDYGSFHRCDFTISGDDHLQAVEGDLTLVDCDIYGDNHAPRVRDNGVLMMDNCRLHDSVLVVVNDGSDGLRAVNCDFYDDVDFWIEQRSHISNAEISTNAISNLVGYPVEWDGILGGGPLGGIDLTTESGGVREVTAKSDGTATDFPAGTLATWDDSADEWVRADGQATVGPS